MKKLLLLAAFLVGCTSGNCRSQREANTVKDNKNGAPEIAAGATAAPVPVPASPATAPAAAPQDRVKVFKYDGSLQCGMGKAIAIDEMAKELTGLRIYSSENKPDGLMHIQMCGSPTGRANVYEIDKTSLEQAKKKGFKEWTFE